jgi:hypothetical protein
MSPARRFHHGSGQHDPTGSRIYGSSRTPKPSTEMLANRGESIYGRRYAFPPSTTKFHVSVALRRYNYMGCFRPGDVAALQSLDGKHHFPEAAFRRLPPKATPGQKPSLPFVDGMAAMILKGAFVGITNQWIGRHRHTLRAVEMGCLGLDHFRQKTGEITTRSVNSSSRPSSMEKVQIQVWKSVRIA